MMLAVDTRQPGAAPAPAAVRPRRAAGDHGELPARGPGSASARWISRPRGMYQLMRAKGVNIRVAKQRIGARTGTPEECHAARREARQPGADHGAGRARRFRQAGRMGPALLSRQPVLVRGHARRPLNCQASPDGLADVGNVVSGGTEPVARSNDCVIRIGGRCRKACFDALLAPPSSSPELPTFTPRPERADDVPGNGRDDGGIRGNDAHHTGRDGRRPSATGRCSSAVNGYRHSTDLERRDLARPPRHGPRPGPRRRSRR